MVEVSSYFSGLCWSCSFLGPVVVVSIIYVPWAQHKREGWAGGGVSVKHIHFNKTF